MFDNIVLVFRDKEKIITNKQVGHMLRTKLSKKKLNGMAFWLVP